MLKEEMSPLTTTYLFALSLAGCDVICKISVVLLGVFQVPYRGCHNVGLGLLF